tara:strand:+ start:4555 stop:5166 length:612 start_codon:yes stop_codon:yes gene_type:complete
MDSTYFIAIFKGYLKMSKSVQLPNQINDFKTATKKAIEIFQGSPVKNLNKLNEAVAQSLGFKNYDHLCGSMKTTTPYFVTESDSIIGGYIVDGNVIDSYLFEEELSDYTFCQLDEMIDDLIDWISEANHSNDFNRSTFSGQQQMMKDDLKILLKWDDNIILKSILTNEYISPSENTERFNEICDDLIDLQKTIDEKDSKNLQQ